MSLSSSASVNFTAMRLLQPIMVFFITAIFLILNACSEPRNFDDEIHTIDSLHVAMDNTISALDSGSLQITDSITRQLKHFQSNYTGIMEHSMAEALLRFGDFRKKAATMEQWKDSLHYRKDQLENELFAFRNTLADRATHDRMNKEINELYADTILQSLIGKQQQWHTKINEWLQQQKAIYNHWNALNDTILTWRANLPKQKQP
jgi:hypothetical protein